MHKVFIIEGLHSEIVLGSLIELSVKLQDSEDISKQFAMDINVFME